MDELKRFFKSIDFSYTDEFSDAIIEKVVFNRDTKVYNVFLKSKNVINYYLVTELFKSAKKGINGKDKCFIEMVYETINDDVINSYIKDILSSVIFEHPFHLIRLKAGNHGAAHLNNGFNTKILSIISKLSIILRVENNLSFSCAVTEVDKDHTTMVANGIHPAAKRYLLAGICKAELITRMGTVTVHNSMLADNSSVHAATLAP